MTPVLMTVSLLAGTAIGLRINARRTATLREQLHLSEQRHDAWNLSAKRTDLAEVGPATPPRGEVELFDQDALTELCTDSADFYGIHSELPHPPVAMTGERDTYAQDRELAEVYGIEAEPCADLTCCPACAGEGGGYIRSGEEWDWEVCDRCRGAGYLPPCVWSDNGTLPCGEPAVGTAELTPGEPVPLCPTHYQWACHGVEDDGAEPGWGHEPLDAEDGESLPSVMPPVIGWGREHARNRRVD